MDGKSISAEDEADLAAFAERADEPTMSYAALLSALKKDGLLVLGSFTV